MRRAAAALAAFAACVLVAGCGDDAVRSGDRPAEPRLPKTVDWKTTSKLVPGRTLHQYALVPDGEPTGRPLLLLLHGFGNGSRSWVTDPVPRLLADLGDDAPVVVSPDGGRDSFWLDRSSGQWASYVVDEVIADAVRRFDIDPTRVAIAGFSMGGYGAFNIARTNPGRFCAVGGHEAAISTTPTEQVLRVFDSRAQYDANDLLAYARTDDAYPDTRLRLDRGRADAFIAGEDAFVAALRDNDVEIDYSQYDGLHSMRSIRPHLEPAMRFYADALADCDAAPGRLARDTR